MAQVHAIGSKNMQGRGEENFRPINLWRIASAHCQCAVALEQFFLEAATESAVQTSSDSLSVTTRSEPSSDAIQLCVVLLESLR